MKIRFQQIKINGNRYKINSLLKTQLDIMKKAVRQDFDCISIVDGEIEGTGKSVLTQQMATYVDPTFCIERIAFSALEFKKIILNSDKYTAVVWDESYEGTNKYSIFGSMNQMIMSLLRQIRQKNLFIFIVIPGFTDLSYDIAVRRSWFLVRAQLAVDYEKLELKRGYFAFYSRARKKWLYFIEAGRLDMKRGYKASNDFVGFFENVYTVNKQLYIQKKSKIRLGGIYDERAFVEECIRRGMPVGTPILLKNYIHYSDRHFLRIKRALTDGHK